MAGINSLRKLEVFCKRKEQGIHVSDDNDERIYRIISHNPHRCKFLLQSTMHQVLQKRLCLYTYKLQAVLAITPDDRVAHKEFAVTMLEKFDEDNELLSKITFSDKATFHVSWKVNKQNIFI